MPNSNKRKGAPRRAPSPGHRADVVEVLARLFAGRPEVRPGKMFGFPAFYTGGRLFACVYGEGVGLKVPAELARALEGTPGIIPFQPYGMAKMKEWVQINRARAEEYAAGARLFQASEEFVGGSATRSRSSAPRARPGGRPKDAGRRAPRPCLPCSATGRGGSSVRGGRRNTRGIPSEHSRRPAATPVCRRAGPCRPNPRLLAS